MKCGYYAVPNSLGFCFTLEKREGHGRCLALILEAREVVCVCVCRGEAYPVLEVCQPDSGTPAIATHNESVILRWLCEEEKPVNEISG